MDLGCRLLKLLLSRARSCAFSLLLPLPPIPSSPISTVSSVCPLPRPQHRKSWGSRNVTSESHWEVLTMETIVCMNSILVHCATAIPSFSSPLFSLSCVRVSVSVMWQWLMGNKGNHFFLYCSSSYRFILTHRPFSPSPNLFSISLPLSVVFSISLPSLHLNTALSRNPTSPISSSTTLLSYTTKETDTSRTPLTSPVGR